MGDPMAQTNVKITSFEGQPCIEIRGQWDHAGMDALIKAYQEGQYADAAKGKALEDAMKDGKALAAAPAEVRYGK